MTKHILENILYRWRVRSGFFCLILVLILAKPNPYSYLLGISVCSVGILVRTWASGHLKKEKELTMSGPYQYSRNPLYLANLIIGISVVIASRSLWTLLLFTVYFLLFYPVVIKRENKRMRELFTHEYEDYEKKVPPFFPSLMEQSQSKRKKFDWSIYRKNREWRALLGALLFWSAMAFKMIFFF